VHTAATTTNGRVHIIRQVKGFIDFRLTQLDLATIATTLGQMSFIIEKEAQVCADHSFLHHEMFIMARCSSLFAFLGAARCAIVNTSPS
jgi:hypothetical protein